MPHHTGVDLILGSDVMIPAGIRLNLYNSTARLPDEVEIPLIKSRSAWLTEPTYGDRVSDGPTESLRRDRAEAAVTPTKSVRYRLHKSVTTEPADDSVRYEPAESAGDDPARSPGVEAVDSLICNEIEVSDVALADDPEEDLRLRFVAAMAMCEDECITAVDNSATYPAEFECSANEIGLEDYAHELAFLPDLTDSASPVLDYGGSNMLPVVLLARRGQRVLAVMMTLRAREISAFVCTLGHFEWLRIPFGLTNAPMIYQRIFDNALWGYVQPRGGWASYAEKVRRAEAASATQRGRLSDPDQPTPDSVNSATKFKADHRALVESDPLQDLVNSPESDMFTNGEPDESTLTPVFHRRPFADNIWFGARRSKTV
ncbi:unnamed protein product [Phytophthora fragariaefolia]|uniref:Unnamed protein product n=1 Tax=Phytophthora fragariaefolia TaxID=1490495 RepID=A0A9W6X2L6_9STRA|nr:unnamed protein product [Phytophthora fragariaefolia]